MYEPGHHVARCLTQVLDKKRVIFGSEPLSSRVTEPLLKSDSRVR